MINPPHLGIVWLDALRALLPYIISMVAVGALIVLVVVEAKREDID